jgi:PilZ domain
MSKEPRPFAGRSTSINGQLNPVHIHRELVRPPHTRITAIKHTSGKVSPQTERRDSPRFLMACRVRYRVIGQDDYAAFSHGRTINMSGSGILLITDGVLPPGRLIEVEIDWPARLDDGVPLKMVVGGKVVRSEERDVALAGVRILRYAFRTAGVQTPSP